MTRKGRASLLVCRVLFAALGFGLGALASPALAQGVEIPTFWDPRTAQERPEIPPTRTIRFLTEDEYPPLHFAGPDGTPTGFSVELARAVCDRLTVPCTVQARRFDTLLDSLAQGNGDVVAAAIPVTGELRQRFVTSLPYFRNPARFVAQRERNQPEASPAALQGRTVAVVAGTAHEAYLKTFFPGATVKPVDTLAAAQGMLRRGEVDYVFADGIGLSLWLGGTDAQGCCGFSGGPYLESRYFGEGIGFVMRYDDEPLRRAIDFALQRLREDGKLAELYLRFFPISPY